MSHNPHRLTPNPDLAAKCREIMGRGAFVELPHNWQFKMTAKECRSVFKAKAKYLFSLAISGNDFPKNWNKGLTRRDIEKCYSIRGFGSTEKIGSVERAKKILAEKKKREDWLKCHGGQHTQDVMRAADEARSKRRFYRAHKGFLKSNRRASRFFGKYFRPNESRLLMNSYEWRRYDDWCLSRKQDAMRRRPPTLSDMRESIIHKAKLDYKLIRAVDFLRNDGAYDFIINHIDNVGIFNSGNYTLNELPSFYRLNVFDWMKKYLIGESLDCCAIMLAAVRRMTLREEFAKQIDCCGSSGNSLRQLRALGFVA